MNRRSLRLLVAIGSLAAAVLIGIVFANTLRWIDKPFPGFFLISNRVVASITLPGEAFQEAARYFQCEVVDVGGKPAASAAQVYAQAAARPPGTSLRYSFRCPSGALVSADLPTQRFTGSDWCVLFGAYLLNGVAFLFTGLLVILLKQSPASVGLLVSGLVTGTFITTAADLYGPHWLVRVHVLAESLLAPSFIHLALVFPTDRLGPRRRRVLAALYGPFLAFAGVYELVFADPAAYTLAHLTASASHGVGALCLMAVVVYDLVRSPSPVVRRKVAVVAAGVVSAFLAPGLLMAASAVEGGKVALNTGALTACLFPLSLGFAIVKQDLFELDLLLRRAITYSIVILVLAGLYFVAFSALGSLLANRNLLAGSPFLLALLNLVLVLLFAPLRARVQDTVDHVFFRHSYASEIAVSELGRELFSAHTHAVVVERTRGAIQATICPQTFDLLRWEGGHLRPSAPGDPPVALPEAIRAPLERGLPVTRYAWDDASDPPAGPTWPLAESEILVPVGTGDSPLGVLALGRKESGRAYSMYDVNFLRAVAAQAALGLTNAEAFARLAELNAGLELQVRDRTASLARAKSELEISLGELQHAYGRLERNQASLIRSERLATLGRLAAGIAHEVNTPLGAVMNTFQLIGDLSREYASSIDDSAVTPDDHREIARELQRAAESGSQFSRKASAYVNKVRAHGREAASAEAIFSLDDLIHETSMLLSHRLRVSCCHLETDVESGLAIVGCSDALGQAMVNLLTNAVDAYEDAGVVDGGIEIRAARISDRIRIEVRDRAGGIPPEVLPHVFDELFTTKDAGRGTGLGLWIARNLIEQRFRGTLEVEVESGVGSCFVIDIPTAPHSAAQLEPSEPAPLPA